MRSRNGRSRSVGPRERVRVTIDVTPATKTKLEWISEVTGWSITRLLEQSAANKARLVLEDMEPGDREAYLSGAMKLDDMFPVKRFRRRAIDVPNEVAVVSAMLSVEAKGQFDLYSRRARMPLGVIVDQLANSMEKRLRKRLPPDPEPALDPSMAEEMQPLAEDA